MDGGTDTLIVSPFQVEAGKLAERVINFNCALLFFCVLEEGLCLSGRVRLPPRIMGRGVDFILGL